MPRAPPWGRCAPRMTGNPNCPPHPIACPCPDEKASSRFPMAWSPLPALRRHAGTVPHRHSDASPRAPCAPRTRRPARPAPARARTTVAASGSGSRQAEDHDVGLHRREIDLHPRIRQPFGDESARSHGPRPAARCCGRAHTARRRRECRTGASRRRTCAAPAPPAPCRRRARRSRCPPGSRAPSTARPTPHRTAPPARPANARSPPPC